MRGRDPIADADAAKCELACEVLRRSGSLRFTALGGSMLPTVWSGDRLTVERVSPKELMVGDIALVGREGRLCAHRVVSIPENTRSRTWITQGDALRTADPPLSENELLGRVTQVVRSGKSKAVSANRSALDSLFTAIVRRSHFAARVFVYLTTQLETQRGSVLPCRS